MTLRDIILDYTRFVKQQIEVGSKHGVVFDHYFCPGVSGYHVQGCMFLDVQLKKTQQQLILALCQISSIPLVLYDDVERVCSVCAHKIVMRRELPTYIGPTVTLLSICISVLHNLSITVKTKLSTNTQKQISKTVFGNIQQATQQNSYSK